MLRRAAMSSDGIPFCVKNLNENTPGRCMAAVVLEVVLSGTLHRALATPWANGGNRTLYILL